MQNYSNSQEQITVKLYNNEGVIFEKSYKLKEREYLYTYAIASVKHSDNQYKLVITEDNFPYDDFVTFKIPVFNKISVLILGGTKEEKILLSKSLFLKDQIERKDISIDLEKKKAFYDIILYYGANSEFIKPLLCTIYLPNNNNGIVDQNRFIKYFSDTLKITGISRNKVFLKTGFEDTAGINVNEIYFSCYYYFLSAFRGYFLTGNERFVHLDKSFIVFNSDIGFKNSNILLTGKFPVILADMIFNSLKQESFDYTVYFRPGDNDIASIKIDGRKEELFSKSIIEKDDRLRIILFIVIFLALINEIILVLRGSYVKKNSISG